MRGARRGLLCGRVGGKLYSDRIGDEVVAKGDGERTRLRESLQFDLFIFYRRKVFVLQSGGKSNYMREGTGSFFLFQIFVFIFIVFAVLCCAVLCCMCFFSFVRIFQKKKTSMCVRTCMYAASGLFSWMEHVVALGIKFCKSPVCTWLLRPSVPFLSSS